MSPSSRAQSQNLALPLVDLRALQAFVAIAEGATFSEAAKRLHLGRPNVSKLIHELEQTLGCRLLTRSPTGSEPTDSGNAALEPAKRVLSAIHALAASLAPGG